jgi:phosphate transport system protein
MTSRGALDPLAPRIVLLGAQVEELVQRAALALLAGDLGEVAAAVTADEEVDRLAHDIERDVSEMLCREHNTARDVAELITALRVVHEIERIGDLMVKVAKARRRLYPYDMEPRVRGLFEQMREQAIAQLRLAVEAFADLDTAKATAIVDLDDVMDDLQRDLFRTILAVESPDAATLRIAVEVALVGRYFERVGDHATNVGERIRRLGSAAEASRPGAPAGQ